jgi:transitional endoplasmic reticulum ATPase
VVLAFLLGLGIGLLLAVAVAMTRRGQPPVAPIVINRLPETAPPPAHAPVSKPAATREQALDLVPPERLPKFDAVGGCQDIKKELLQTIGLVLSHPQEAGEYGISWNGLLFHGPPGVGKSFIVRALAGQLGLNFVPIATSDLVSEYAGEGPQKVDAAFRFAAQHLPCLLFFDEFDAVGEDRNDTTDSQARDVLAQLLSSLEEYRHEPRLVVAAATNDLDALDPAVIRPGRFDRHIRLDLPDEETRKAIFAARLNGRPVAKELALDELARRTRGRTPAAIAQACELAALAAFRQSAGTGKKVRISGDHLLAALEHGAGEDRPTIEEWSWDRLVLPERTRQELRQLQTLVEDPEQSHRLGVDPPTGVLLTGPPGTGKTTIAKVLAAEAACSFYPVSGADVTSRWVGESEQRIARLFNRARANAPSIIFIDEIDAIGGQRGQLGTYDRQIDQLLQEIDGVGTMPGVFVIGATNRPTAVDPALVRGGRLSRVIDIPLPDADGRLAILTMLTAAMPLDAVDVEELALQTEGFSGADLNGLCQQAAIEALVRRSTGTVNVTAHDFDQALDGTHVHDQRNRRRPLRAEEG